MGHIRPFGRCELSLESPVQKLIQHGLLTFVQRKLDMGLPESIFPEHRGQRIFRAADGQAQTFQEPCHPFGDVERALLGSLQYLVVILSLPAFK